MVKSQERPADRAVTCDVPGICEKLRRFLPVCCQRKADFVTGGASIIHPHYSNDSSELSATGRMTQHKDLIIPIQEPQHPFKSKELVVLRVFHLT